MSSVHVALSTHRTLHLRRTLLGVSVQSRPATSVIVSVDGDPDDVRRVVREASAEFGLRIVLTMRPHQGVCRSAQVRNNAVRALRDPRAGVTTRPDDIVVFYDGDCCPAPDALEQHTRLHEATGSRGVVLGHWIPLTPEQTEAFDEAALRAGNWPAKVNPELLSKLAHREKRYRRQMFLKRIWLEKAHKPKLASGNFSVRLGDYLSVNGFDEGYEGYGQEDDDLGRRLYDAGVRPIVGVRQCLVFHQWHVSRAPTDWHNAPGVVRFNERYRVRAELGMNHPKNQPASSVEVFEPVPLA